MHHFRRKFSATRILAASIHKATKKKHQQLCWIMDDHAFSRSSGVMVMWRVCGFKFAKQPKRTATGCCCCCCSSSSSSSSRPRWLFGRSSFLGGRRQACEKNQSSANKKGRIQIVQIAEKKAEPVESWKAYRLNHFMDKNHLLSASWWQLKSFLFSPLKWGDDPIWRAICCFKFQMGWQKSTK